MGYSQKIWLVWFRGRHGGPWRSGGAFPTRRDAIETARNYRSLNASMTGIEPVSSLYRDWLKSPTRRSFNRLQHVRKAEHD